MSWRSGFIQKYSATGYDQNGFERPGLRPYPQVDRSIYDLTGELKIATPHVVEAIKYRNPDHPV